MELSFVLSALRRRFWVVVLCVLLGALPALLTDPPVGQKYQSIALVQVREPTQANAGWVQSDADRYVLGQLAILESARLANEVSAATQISVAEIDEIVEIIQEPNVDVVSIVATVSGTELTAPQMAQRVAQSYLDAYMNTLETERRDDAYLESIDEKIEINTNLLNNINAAIAKQMQRHLDRAVRANPGPVPSLNEVDPARAAERDVLKSELIDLNQRRNAHIADSRLRVNTITIQQASLPAEPLPAGGQFLLAGGLLGGAMFGVVIALAWARFSTKVLDQGAASEIMGIPVVAELPYYRSLSRDPLSAFQALPRPAIPVIDQLCVRAEAKARLDEPLQVVVVGTQRESGTTTLALAMANRFAATGSSVVLVDADVRNPLITSIFNASDDGGVVAVANNDGALVDQRGRSVFTRTMDPEVSVLGLGSVRGSAYLRRDSVSTVIAAASMKAQVVVVDAGPALDMASTLEFSKLADVVVLAVPLARQKSDALADMARQLDVRAQILPVVTSPTRRPGVSELNQVFDVSRVQPGITRNIDLTKSASELSDEAEEIGVNGG